MPCRPCKWPACPTLIERGERYCERHQPRGQAADAHAQRTYDRGRPRDAVSFYHSAAWTTLRLDVLRDEPVCRSCRREFSQHVDHIQPRTIRPELELDRDNLQGLCAACHNKKSGRERRK